MIDRIGYLIFVHGVFVLLGWGAVSLQLIKGDFYLQKAENNYIRLLPLPAERGTVYDRNGEVLVRDTPEFEISMIPGEVKNKQYVFDIVSRITGTPPEAVMRTYRKNYLYPFAYTPLVQHITKAQGMRFEELALAGVFVTTRWKRYYLYPFSTTHVLGYVKEMQESVSKLKKYGFSPGTRVGYTGVEQQYDEYLRGQEGGLQVEVDSRGRTMNFLGRKAPERGKDIYLTIDKNMQESAYNALQGHQGSLIFMDVRTGEVLALVNQPSFNNNDFIEGKNISELFVDERKPLLNRALQGEFPPGSIFKIVTAAAALSENKITPATTHECLGYFNLGNAISKCWTTHGVVNLYDALKVSCNVYFWNVAMMLNKEPIIKWARIFGYGKTTGIDIPNEKKGTVPSRAWKQAMLHEDWYGGDTLNLAIGQGFLQVTPLQGLEMISIVARNGMSVVPYLVKRIDDIQMKHESSEKIPLAEEHLAAIKVGLRKVVNEEHGTAHSLSVLDLKLAGKTGTAQVPPKAPHGWFVGYFPYDAPQYSIIVFLEHGSAGAEAVKVGYNFLKELTEKGWLKGSS